MLRSKALVIVTRQITHVCPYKGQEQVLALCYVRAQDVAERDFCFGCDHVDTLKERFGLRTFKRKLVVSKCKHCADDISQHGDKGGCAFCTRCPGFEPVDDEGIVYVATNVECTEWMTVNVATGERLPYVEQKAKWAGEAAARRHHIPLLGAPGTVPSDSRDEIRIEAANYAARKRGRGPISDLDEEDEPKPTTKTRGRKKKTP